MRRRPTDRRPEPQGVSDKRAHQGAGVIPRDWSNEAIRRIEADFNRSSDTHLLRLEAPALAGIDIYLKDESTHPSGSLKHRLARSLFLFAICNGWISEGTTVVEASSGSTAISEAYFARLLDLPFVAVMPRLTSAEKIAAIEFQGARCEFVDDPRSIYDAARRVAASTGGHYLDQFTFAERATDWRGNNNIADSIFAQMAREPQPVPRWIVVSAGTGGTSATIGRYLRYCHFDTRLCVVDTDNSVFFDCWEQGRRDLVIDTASRIEGIGRPRFEPSFIPEVVDRMLRVPDAASLGAMHALSRCLGRRVGGSTGTNLYGLCRIAAEMRAEGEAGSLVTMICDSGERYRDTYYNLAWLADRGLDIAPATDRVTRLLVEGVWDDGGV